MDKVEKQYSPIAYIENTLEKYNESTDNTFSENFDDDKYNFQIIKQIM